MSVIPRCQRRVKKLTSHARSNDKHVPPAASNGTLKVEELLQAELAMVQAVQQESFVSEIKALRLRRCAET